MVPEADESEESPLEQVVAGGVVALTFLAGFGLLALGHPWFWIAFPVGFAGILPAAIGLVRLYESRRETVGEGRDERADALASLRERYAGGEIDEDEFEARLELLLETESVSEAEAYAARREAEGERTPDRERESA